jgi:dihydropteridine reductase
MAVARALVYGGKGALGSAIVSHFKANNWWVASLDLFPSEEADANVIITATDSWTDQANEVHQSLDHYIAAAICTVGWP